MDRWRKRRESRPRRSRSGARPRGEVWREYPIAWLFPLAVGALAYSIAWASGLVAFEVPSGFREQLGELSDGAFVAISAGSSLTLGALVAATTATGEELGWRGYMLTRLIDAGVPRPALVSGMIWAAWHAPIILSGQYAAARSLRDL